MRKERKQKYLKRLLHFAVFFYVFQCFMIFTEAETVTDYDAEKAVNYAKEHYDDTEPTPDCIRFVKECVEAGGVPTDEARTYGYTVKNYVDYAVSNGYAEYNKIITEEMPWNTPQWYVSVEDNIGILSVGDGIIYKCTSCGTMFHASLYTGNSEDGYAQYYAQNTAVAGELLCKIDCSACDGSRENVELYSLHITSTENGYDDHYNNEKISGLNVALNDEGKVQISWDSLDGATGYKVFRKNGKNSVYNCIGDSSETYFVYDNEELDEEDKLVEGTTYYFAVRPYTEKEGKTYVGSICDMFVYKHKEKVNGQLSTPVVTAENIASTGKPRLTWELVSGADEYHVYRKNSSGQYVNVFQTDGMSYTHSSAEPGKTYYYKVMAVSKNEAVESSEYSEVISRTCDLPTTTTTISNVSSTGKIKISWEAVDGADKYYVYRSTSGKTGTFNRIYTASASKLSVVHTGAVSGKKYWYMVRAVDADNSSANSANSNIVSRVCDLPATTAKVSNVASTGKIKISWEAVDGADKYYVYRSTSGKTGTFERIYTASASKLSVVHTGAVSGKKYWYMVRAVDADNSSANSANSNIVSRVCDLKSPVIKATILSNGKPKISWGAVDGADKYYVYRSTSGKTGTFERMYIASASKLSVTHTGAKKNTTYYYMVRAVDADNSSANSANSNTVSAKCKK